MKKIIILTAVLLIFTSFVYSAGNSENLEKTNDRKIDNKIVIAGPRSPVILPAFRLQENKKSDIPDVEVKVYTSMEAMMALAQSDDVDFILLPSNSASILFNKNFDIKLMNVFQWGGLFLSTTDQNCRCWEDLAGKVLYVPSRGSVPDMTTQLFLRKHGLTARKDLKIVYSNHSEIAQLLSQGSISYAVDVQPFVTAHRKSLKNYRIISEYCSDWEQIAGNGYKMPGFCMIAKTSAMERGIPFLTEFNSAFAEAVNTVSENTELSGKLAEKHINAPADLIAGSIDKLNLVFKKPDEIRADVEKYFELLCSMKPAVIGGKLPADDFYLNYEK